MESWKDGAGASSLEAAHVAKKADEKARSEAKAAAAAEWQSAPESKRPTKG